MDKNEFIKLLAYICLLLQEQKIGSFHVVALLRSWYWNFQHTSRLQPNQNKWSSCGILWLKDFFLWGEMKY